MLLTYTSTEIETLYIHTAAAVQVLDFKWVGRLLAPLGTDEMSGDISL